MIKAMLFAAFACTFVGIARLAFGRPGWSTGIGVVLLICGAAMLLTAAMQAREERTVKHRARVVTRKAQAYWLLHLACVVGFYAIAIPTLFVMAVLQAGSWRAVGWGAVLIMFAALLFDELRYRAEDEANDETVDRDDDEER